MKLDDIFTFRNWAIFLFVLFCIRYIPIETRAGISTLKVATSGICAFMFLAYLKPHVNKALVCCTVYLLYIYMAASFHPESFRVSTILYTASFLITYCTFYELVYFKKLFTLDFFILLVRKLIIIFFAVLLIHQFLRILGFQELLIVNMQSLHRGMGSNSLFGEPSTFARTMGVLYYAYLKCNEYKQGHAVNIQQVFNRDHRWVTIGFLWSMFTMGSGTAFICLGVLSLYFLKGAYFVFAIPIFIAVYFTLSYFEVKQFERATSVAEATMTGDVEEIQETDGSASSRIAPLLNTINNLDINESETWFGHGTDYSYKIARSKGIRKIGEIDDYGLIAYFLSLLIVFACAINFNSLATVMYFLGIGGGTSNIPYLWGLLMIMTCIRYFNNHYDIEDEEVMEEEEEEG